jgi:FMN phosphatase YigB (HAD superfamily)
MISLINTILFDLDGTLLPLDPDLFEAEYFKRLCYKLRDLYPAEKLGEYIWDASAEMVKNIEHDKTNKDVFMKRFAEITGGDMEFLYNRFMEFYKNEYKALNTFFKPSEYMVKAVKLLKEKRYELVVATNPLFPMEAIVERIKWAGLNIGDFKLVTSFEDMHFCKPQIKYYEEILSRVGKIPDECLMVGNDVQEDLIAKTIGIKTYLVEDHILNKKNVTPITDYRGSYKDFYEFAKGLVSLLNEEECGTTTL